MIDIIPLILHYSVMDDRVAYWLEISEYDLQTAKAMLDSGRYLYVGFMCHQSIEKILKAYWQMEKRELPPRTHNLLYLAVETGINREMSDGQLECIDELSPLNIEARYPEYKTALSEKYTHGESRRLYDSTRGLHEWIKKKLL